MAVRCFKAVFTALGEGLIRCGCNSCLDEIPADAPAACYVRVEDIDGLQSALSSAFRTLLGSSAIMGDIVCGGANLLSPFESSSR